MKQCTTTTNLPLTSPASSSPVASSTSPPSAQPLPSSPSPSPSPFPSTTSPSSLPTPPLSSSTSSSAFRPPSLVATPTSPSPSSPPSSSTPLPTTSPSLPSSSPISSLPSPPQGLQVHTHILTRGFHSDNRVLNSLLTFYSSSSSSFGNMSYARNLFDYSREYSDVVSWNIIVNGYVRAGQVDIAKKVFDKMPVRDEVSWSAMVSGYAGKGEMDLARGLMERMPGGGNLVVWNSMVAGFARKGMVGLAREWFDGMVERNLVSWNAMVSGYAMNGEMDLARELFELMKERDVVSWSCVISGYTQSERHLEAVELFKVMLSEGRVKPNEITMVSVLSACAHLSALDQGKWIHDYIGRHRMVLDDDYNLGAALIDMYSKCGEMETAINIFGSLNRKNVSSWNALITGLAINSFSRDCLVAFEEMQRSGTKPNDITFVGLLTACTHGGLVAEGQQYFNKMSAVYGVQPELKHYGCVIDMLGRAGLLEEAERIVKTMPMKPDVMVMGALLGACQIHGDVEIAESVRSNFLEVNKSEQAGCHILLSNIYAAGDRWADAYKTRESLKENGIRKRAAGSSSVESGGVMQEVKSYV